LGAKITSYFRKVTSWLPWINFIWGFSSAFLLTRHFSAGGRLSLYALGFIVFLIFMSLWSFYSRRLEHIPSENLQGFQKILIRRKSLIEFAGTALVQFFVQYIFAFCLPFLYFKESWSWLFLFTSVAFVALWDPLWEKCFKTPFFRVFLRLIIASLVYSFLYPILLSSYLNFFYVGLFIIAVCSLIPWEIFFLKKKSKHAFLISATLFGMVLLQMFIPGEYRFPAISLWLEDSSLAKEGEGKFCAQTPIVAPFGLHDAVTHQWFVNNKPLGTISLPPIVGVGNDNSYHTFSCKNIFQKIEKGDKITCKTFLKSGIYIGEVSLYSY
jgi:hypothetical protein